uniref:Uncharacterized protein n=1 Tax=Timema monikensis TaxID=170555 RepID=A0A7R9E029_9NEOP|nr:unnamed protein product [Timema monikensis]
MVQVHTSAQQPLLTFIRRLSIGLPAAVIIGTSSTFRYYHPGAVLPLHGAGIPNQIHSRFKKAATGLIFGPVTIALLQKWTLAFSR